MLSIDALKMLEKVVRPSSPTWDQFISQSNEFEKQICERPTTTNWLDENVKRDTDKGKRFHKCIRDCYPILHESVLPLIEDFVEAKKRMRTTAEEIEVYHDEFNVLDMVERIISKRPAVFMDRNDKHILRNGHYGAGSWDMVGSGETGSPCSLKDYMSYDEIKLGALLQVTSPVLPINSGDRHNQARVDDDHVSEAVYVGAVGARLTRPLFMECQEMVISQKLCIPKNGYGEGALKANPVRASFGKFYGLQSFPSFDECRKRKINMDNITVRSNKEFFNHEVYINRIRVSAETFLLEAEHRGEHQKKDLHVHVVGLGLGVWARDRKMQPKFFIQAFQRAIENLTIKRIKRLDFSWIPADTDFEGSRIKPNEEFKGIKITFTKRDPFEKLPGDEEGRLVVAMYAWDGNSLPGNEYWGKMLKSTGDPAAACCSQIAQFQNCCINKQKIQASNVHIASVKHGGIFHIAKYAKMQLNQ